MATPDEPEIEPSDDAPVAAEEPEASGAASDLPDDEEELADPTSGTDLGLGPEPDLDAVALDAEPEPAPPAAPAEPFRAGTLIPAVPAATPVVREVSAQQAARSPFHPRRTWAQRSLLVLNCIVILACFAGAGALLVARNIRNDIQSIDLGSGGQPAAAPPESTTVVEPVGTGSTLVNVTPTNVVAPESTQVGDTTPVTVADTAPSETFPPADPAAKNFLITGADNNACIDPDSPFAGAFGDREGLGERSDTVMVMRVDPANKRAAILSFPRDLWVQIADRGSKQRINTAYVRDDPRRLIATIVLNFSVGIDHFIQVDFCAFKTLVEAVGGVAVPFTFPARDDNTGLDVPVFGGECFTFDGDHALAYVRSRYYEYQDAGGTWKQDPASDLGRVSRQQDFIRRALDAALAKGFFDPSVARGIIDIATQNIVVDSNLTPSKMLEFFGVLRDFEPGTIHTYQIEATPEMISGNSVLVPRIKGENMQAILRIFQGIAPLAAAPEQVFESTTTTTDDDDATTTTRPTGSAATTTTLATTTSTTIATGTTTAVVEGPQENIKGIVPPNDITC